jgi:hypothetical protein
VYIQYLNICLYKAGFPNYEIWGVQGVVFCSVMSYRLVTIFRRFGGTYWIFLGLNIKALCCFEVSNCLPKYWDK